jgi:hypothetical protein
VNNIYISPINVNTAAVVRMVHLCQMSLGMLQATSIFEFKITLKI